MVTSRIHTNLTTNYPWRRDPGRCIACVNDELRLGDDLLVVIIGVIGEDNYAVVLTESLQWHTFHLKIVLASLSNLWEIGVVVVNSRATLLQSLNDRECR